MAASLESNFCYKFWLKCNLGVQLLIMQCKKLGFESWTLICKINKLQLWNSQMNYYIMISLLEVCYGLNLDDPNCVSPRFCIELIHALFWFDLPKSKSTILHHCWERLEETLSQLFLLLFLANISVRKERIKPDGLKSMMCNMTSKKKKKRT